jgi:hypothetical protein
VDAQAELAHPNEHESIKGATLELHGAWNEDSSV